MPQRLPHMYDTSKALGDLQHVIYEKKNHIAYITFNRPERLNSFNQRMSEELYAIWNDVRRDNDVYVAIVAGLGRAWQAGRDVKELFEYQARGEIVPRDDPNNIYYHVEAFPKFAECDKPIIAAIQGLCAGGGLSMLVETHIRIMADDAYLTDGHLNVGQLISPARYIEDFGWAAAMYLYLCKGKLTAQQAFQLGIVNEVCPKEQVVQRATEIAEMMMDIEPTILQRGAELSNRVMEIDPSYQQLAHSLRYTVQEQEDVGAESAKAFVEKRKGSWKK